MRKNQLNRQAAAAAAQNTTETATETAVMQVVKGEEPAAPTEQDAAPALATEQSEATSQDAAPEQPAPAAVAKPVPLDDILERVNRIKAVSERLSQHRATGETLAAFQIGTSGFQDTLTLRDGTGKEWRTHRTPAIQMVLDLLRG
jgi:hypothetical protein